MRLGGTSQVGSLFFKWIASPLSKQRSKEDLMKRCSKSTRNTLGGPGVYAVSFGALQHYEDDIAGLHDLAPGWVPLEAAGGSGQGRQDSRATNARQLSPDCQDHLWLCAPLISSPTTRSEFWRRNPQITAVLNFEELVSASPTPSPDQDHQLCRYRSSRQDAYSQGRSQGDPRGMAKLGFVRCRDGDLGRTESFTGGSS